MEGEFLVRRVGRFGSRLKNKAIRACAINDKQHDLACNNLKVRIRPYNLPKTSPHSALKSPLIWTHFSNSAFALFVLPSS